jgi:hypothetical protein
MIAARIETTRSLSMKKFTTAALSLLLLAALPLAAQEQKKKPLSPPAKAEATIAGKKVSVDYSAPSKRGRVIMGELVPFGKVWRTGANAATTLETSADLMFGSVHVPAGKYTLYTIPGEEEWTLIINKQTGQWGSDYDQTQDLGRVKMSVKPLPKVAETFEIGLAGTTGSNGVLTLTWENTQASVPFMVH